ncbi:hypothetical protein D187_005492 [Cystobacter fuscus DSM 2262]|uniref:Uncharacterized protein n=1 Tax=Cystobacter fuscus (strain ATCC 25194 / DSM 2262 / NBRC 100088 / M29) TaxID=1242864 RepID=S9R5U7_CYSF2|nr:hypothetical protein D187_005492 [Cystobacter fuscus DSM 2262]
MDACIASQQLGSIISRCANEKQLAAAYPSVHGSDGVPALQASLQLKTIPRFGFKKLGEFSCLRNELRRSGQPLDVRLRHIRRIIRLVEDSVQSPSLEVHPLTAIIVLQQPGQEPLVDMNVAQQLLQLRLILSRLFEQHKEVHRVDVQMYALDNASLVTRQVAQIHLPRQGLHFKVLILLVRLEDALARRFTIPCHMNASPSTSWGYLLRNNATGWSNDCDNNQQAPGDKGNCDDRCRLAEEVEFSP